MDPSLWLLARLRLGAAARRWQRSLAQPRGILVSVAVAMLFLPSIGVAIAMMFIPMPTRPTGPIERFGPVGLFGFTLLGLATPNAAMGLYFTPAEIDFLFTGPFHRRQLLTYKLTLLLIGTLVSSLFFGTMGSAMSPRFASAFSASFLALMFLQLTQMVVAMATNRAANFAPSRASLWAVAGLLALPILVILPGRDVLLSQDWKAVGLAAETSPITTAVLAPFRWFILVYTAEDWTSLVRWGSRALLLDLSLVGAIFALDSGYLEASAASSARALLKAQKMMRSGGVFKFSAGRRGRFALKPAHPLWMGGVGPNLWRQLVAATANPAPLIVLVLITGGLSYAIASIPASNGEIKEVFVVVGLASGMSVTIFLSLFLPYDFRGDLDVMETLKMLPIAPGPLALGQVLTPAFLASVVQGAGCLGTIAGLGRAGDQAFLICVGLGFLLPANLLFYQVENLLFLWYPSRIVVGQFNGSALIRQMMTMVAKGFAIGSGGGLVLAVGSVGYFASGRFSVGAILAWTTLVLLNVGLQPLLGQAFENFDVSRDIPE